MTADQWLTLPLSDWLESGNWYKIFYRRWPHAWS